jgi:uncharacterized protein YdeI (YjbR/CyaY-like superfamily)
VPRTVRPSAWFSVAFRSLATAIDVHKVGLVAITWVKLMPTQQIKQIAPRNRMEWRAWLEENYARAHEVWLVFYKRHTGASSLTYNDAVEEALCFGWIDGVRRALDNRRYMHRLSPRKSDSKWSELNKARAQRMLDTGLMKPPGLRAIDEAKRNGHWSAPVRRPPASPMSAEFESHLRKNKKAAQFFASLASSHQRQYRDWIASAKREETRARRIEEALKLLVVGEKLGMR